ncbi:hypothetical protein ABT274_12235 [Streptomyces sp. NPDC001127]|uniref:hypothetical protein n=1 Tax=Streptomyces sp. NPDC001127 TaxID=3154377 RepID=UPI00332C677B
MRERTLARPSVIPYVAAWDSESAGPESDLTYEYHRGRPRLAYKGPPLDDDRDGSDVLWGRVSHSPYVGEPLLGFMHSGRQYECMYALKCQVCRCPASKNEDGYLFFDWPKPGDPPTWPEGALTTQPPLCERHGRMATKLCPHAPEFVALRVGLPRLWGVTGTAYTWTDGGWISDPDLPPLKYGDERLRAVVASHLVRQLRKVKVVEFP